MKTILLSLLALLSFASNAAAQTVQLGKRVPDIRPREWLAGVRPSGDAQLYAIEFCHAGSQRSIANLEKLRLLAQQTGGGFQIIAVAGGDRSTAAEAFKKFADEGLAVAIDDEGRYFKSFGVTYLPACAITDKSGRALWVGDSGQLTPAMIQRLKEQK